MLPSLGLIHQLLILMFQIRNLFLCSRSNCGGFFGGFKLTGQAIDFSF